MCTVLVAVLIHHDSSIMKQCVNPVQTDKKKTKILSANSLWQCVKMKIQNEIYVSVFHLQLTHLCSR